MGRLAGVVSIEPNAEVVRQSDVRFVGMLDAFK
jgi:hypothetical protein